MWISEVKDRLAFRPSKIRAKEECKDLHKPTYPSSKNNNERFRDDIIRIEKDTKCKQQ
jgi:hypothetical protein